MRKAGLLPLALIAVLVVVVFLPVMAPSVLAWSCSPETSVAVSSRGVPVWEVKAGTPIAVAAEYDGGCMTLMRPNVWVIEMRGSDGLVRSTQWQSISPTESLPYRLTTQWVPLRADNYEIRAKLALNLTSYCSDIDSSQRDYQLCQRTDLPAFVPDLASGSAGLTVLGDLKGIMRDLRVIDRFDADAKFTRIPVNLDSVVQVTLKPLRRPAAHPSFLTFDIYDSKGKLVHTGTVYDPVKSGTPMFIRSDPGTIDTFSNIDWNPSKTGKYTIKVTLTDSLTEPKISTYVVKTVRVVSK